MNPGGTPAVSVVTPFYNTAAYLRECIESVLRQSYRDFEYLLVNNRSTDGSDRIAAEYAARDPRIRLIHNTEFVGQVENYNGAIAQVSPQSRYVKVVQADDWIFPECLANMVALADRHPTVALVASYYLCGSRVMGFGVAPGTEVLSGRETCRGHLLGTLGFFGTPTTLLYRADLVRRRRPFYAVGRLHEDSELCFESLRDADCGFVHQVLSFMRLDNESVLGGRNSYDWQELDAYLLLRMYGPEYLTPSEYRAALKRRRRRYLRRLGEAAVLLREQGYWNYQRRGLASVGEHLQPLAVAPYLLGAIGRAAIRPGPALRLLRSRVFGESDGGG
jgi:glycosyltransferase involved in cell wall biosynthesis